MVCSQFKFLVVHISFSFMQKRKRKKKSKSMKPMDSQREKSNSQIYPYINTHTHIQIRPVVHTYLYVFKNQFSTSKISSIINQIFMLYSHIYGIPYRGYTFAVTYPLWIHVNFLEGFIFYFFFLVQTILTILLFLEMSTQLCTIGLHIEGARENARTKWCIDFQRYV